MMSQARARELTSELVEHIQVRSNSFTCIQPCFYYLTPGVIRPDLDLSQNIYVAIKAQDF